MRGPAPNGWIFPSLFIAAISVSGCTTTVLNLPTINPVVGVTHAPASNAAPVILHPGPLSSPRPTIPTFGLSVIEMVDNTPRLTAATISRKTPVDMAALSVPVPAVLLPTPRPLVMNPAQPASPRLYPFADRSDSLSNPETTSSITQSAQQTLSASTPVRSPPTVAAASSVATEPLATSPRAFVPAVQPISVETVSLTATPDTSKPSVAAIGPYALGSTSLPTVSTSTLASIMERAHAAKTIVITGFTDRSGSELTNRHTAILRASSMRNVLILKGIPASRIRVFYSTDAANATSTVDPDARRVELLFLPDAPAKLTWASVQTESAKARAVGSIGTSTLAARNVRS